MVSVRRYLRYCNPYIALLTLALPLAIVEPLKFAGALALGTGHVLTGATAVAVAYAGSLLLVHRLFTIVKPNLLRLSWFAGLWEWFLSARRKAWRRLRALIP
jgi:hypothetical protein